jgi:hypothetical protein
VDELIWSCLKKASMVKSWHLPSSFSESRIEVAVSAPVSPAFVEAVMVNSTYNQGIAFNSPARVLEEKP